MKIDSERLTLLREHARLERFGLLETQGRLGVDPLATLTDLPSIDEFVVVEIRDQILEQRGQLAEFSMARVAARGKNAEALIHRQNSDRVEFEILREIAAENPELTVAAWNRVSRLQTLTPSEFSESSDPQQ